MRVSDGELARLWAQQVQETLSTWQIEAADIDLVGSHGQTIHHTPGAPGSEGGARKPATTLQVGHGDILAESIGVPVVSDFRVRDIALGGEGAPLIPYADWVLFGDEAPVACHNLGSIANVTLVTPDLAGCRAFDTGPANALIDAFARMAEGPDGQDTDGRLSAEGKVDDDLHLALWTACAAWLAQKPPKSAGFGTFDGGLAERIAAQHPDASPADRVRTAVAFTAACLKHAYEWHVLPHHPAHRRVLFSGGGTRNVTLMAEIETALRPLGLEVHCLAPAESDAKEAVGFALLAEAYLRGAESNVCAATGARSAAPLGRLSLPTP